MKKKIIEKLELPYDDGKGNFSSGSGEIHILRKVNEIIDVLNSWVFEPTLTIPSQSQKQPEGDYVNTEPEKVIVDPIGVDFTTEGKNREFPVEYKTREEIGKMFKPEKQEEWKEGLDNIDLMLAMLQSIENCTDEEVRNTAKAIREELDKVSQLLSESKEKAKIEVLEKVLEKKTNYEMEREEHGYRVTLEYVLADDIKKEIKLLKEGDDLQE